MVVLTSRSPFTEIQPILSSRSNKQRHVIDIEHPTEITEVKDTKDVKADDQSDLNAGVQVSLKSLDFNEDLTQSVFGGDV